MATSDVHSVIKEQIRLHRKGKAWTGKDLCDRLNRHGLTLNPAQLSKIENGGDKDKSRSVGLDEALVFAVAFGVPLWSLLQPLTDKEKLRFGNTSDAPTYSGDAIAEWFIGGHPLPDMEPDEYLWGMGLARQTLAANTLDGALKKILLANGDPAKEATIIKATIKMLQGLLQLQDTDATDGS